MKKLYAQTVKTSSISEELKKQMFNLFSEYYDDVSWQKFCVDLNEKTHVFLFFTKSEKRLAGFSTILRKKIPDISPGIFLYSGDTVMHQDFWGAKILQKSFFFFIVESKLKSPFSPVYWMLISKGHKTYLMMRKNFRNSFPNNKEATPKLFQMVQDKFYLEKFKSDYDQKSGLITFKEKLGAVKGEIAHPTKKQLEDSDTAFFLKKNPLFHQGVELACICEIRFQDFLLHIPKFFLKFKK
ncbi:MAG: hypothetical protein ACOYL6_06715 [Bacteriovoracaceae bacterium]